MATLTHILILTTTLVLSTAQKLISPCPSFFKYYPLSPSDDTWEGNLTLTTQTELSGVWLRIVFDKAPLEVDTDFGESVQRESTDYLIKQPDKRLKVGEKETLKISVKFNKKESPPQLLGFRLNARVVCPENGVIPRPEEKIDLRLGELEEIEELDSPCPDIFTFENNISTNETWFGNIKIKSDKYYSGVTVTVVLDRQALQLGNWFGEVTTPDNIAYTIKNPNKQVRKNEDVKVRLFIKYKPELGTPKIKEIRFNNQAVCFVPVIRPTTTTTTELPEDEDSIIDQYSSLVDLGQRSNLNSPSTWESPCPNIFVYEPIGPNDDTWQGDLTISTETELSGVWLRFIFDGAPIEVNSNFGEVLQREATEYLIRRPEKGLRVGTSETLRVSVKFDTLQPPPKIVGIRLNARVLCPENGVIEKPAIDQRPMETFTNVPALQPVLPKLISPCPTIFEYEPLRATDDTWYAGLTISTETELSGVWLRIIFDNPPIEVNSDFGEVVQREANEYLIRRPEKGLKIKDKESLRLWVKFNTSAPIPQLVGIRLNARVICPENGVLIKPGEKVVADVLPEKYVEQTTVRPPTRPPKPVVQRMESVCPSILQYRPLSSIEDDWTADLTISTKQRLAGIWLIITFDRQPVEVTSNFGAVEIRGTNEYSIRRPSKILTAGNRENIEINVKFDINQPPPHIVEIKLNNRVICPENNIYMITESATEQYFEQTTKRLPPLFTTPGYSQGLLSSSLGISNPSKQSGIPDVLSEIPLDEIPDDPNIIDQKIIVFPKFYYIIQKYPQYSIIHIKRKKQN